MEIQDLIFQGKIEFPLVLSNLTELITISCFSNSNRSLQINGVTHEKRSKTCDKRLMRMIKKIVLSFDERNTTNHENGESEMIFYQELLFEVFAGLFVEFCADSHNISIFINSESFLLKLKYLAHQGFKEYLGIYNSGIVAEYKMNVYGNSLYKVT